jgi:hypothetical protein
MIRHDSQPRLAASLRARFAKTATNTLSTSTDSHQDTSGHRHSRAVRISTHVAIVSCCLATLAAVNATSASAFTTPAYVSHANLHDTMSRTVASGLGTPNQGATYATSPKSLFSVSGGRGHINSIAKGHGASAAPVGAHLSERLQLAFSLPKIPTSGAMYAALEFRRQASGADYRVRLGVTPGGIMTLGFSRVRQGHYTTVGSRIVVPGRATAGSTIMLDGLVAGRTAVTLRGRAWLASAAAPGWQAGTTDSSRLALDMAGVVGMYFASATSAAASKVTLVSFDGSYLTLANPPAPAPGTRPGAANTGVPAGTPTLTRHGALTITKSGVYDHMDVHGFVTIKASNVTIKRSILRGGVATSGNPGLVSVSSTATNFVLEDSALVPEHPSVAIDGIRGANYTLLRVDIHGTVDGAKIIGNNVTIANSWIHGTVAYAHDPYQSNGPSHNDAIQVLGGHNIHITGNTIAGGSNSGVQVTQGSGSVANFGFTGNWADGGACTVNLADKPLATMSSLNISNNVFGHTSTYKNCAIVYSTGVSMTHTGNYWAGTRILVALSKRQ